MSNKKHRKSLSRKFNEAHKEIIVKGPAGPKLPISIYEQYRLSPHILHQDSQWRNKKKE